MTIRYALKQYGRKKKRNGIAFAAVVAVFAACAASATARTLDVTAYGAKPDGVTDNTAAIQKAIDECSAKGGGRVLVPGGGAYMTYTLSLKNNVVCPHSRWGIGFFYPDEASGWAKHKDPPRGQGLVPPPPETLIPFYMENVRFSNVHITCEDEPIWLKVDNGTPFQYMRDISFSDCSFRSGVPPHIECCAKHRGHFSNWRFSNVTFDFRRMKWAKKPTAADIFRAVDGFEFIDTRFSLYAKPAK